MSALPAYSLLLGLIALLGYMAIAAKVKPIVTDGKADTNTVVPVLFDQMFPHWFAGVAFAAVAIGALVPAAIMSIAAANLFTRNIYVEYIRPDADPARAGRRQQDRVAGREDRRGCGDPADQPAVLHRPAVDRRRHHPADAARGRGRSLHAVATPLGPGRRLDRRHGPRHVDALPDPEPGHEPPAFRRFGVRDRRSGSIRRRSAWTRRRRSTSALSP